MNACIYYMHMCYTVTWHMCTHVYHECRMKSIPLLASGGELAASSETRQGWSRPWKGAAQRFGFVKVLVPAVWKFSTSSKRVKWRIQFRSVKTICDCPSSSSLQTVSNNQNYIWCICIWLSNALHGWVCCGTPLKRYCIIINNIIYIYIDMHSIYIYIYVCHMYVIFMSYLCHMCIYIYIYIYI